MTANRPGFVFVFCIIALALVPLTAHAEGQADSGAMGGGDGLYVTAGYALALPGTATFHLPDPGAPTFVTDADTGTDWGFLGGRLGVGYAISGFRPELAFGYRSAPITSVTLTKFEGATAEAVLNPINDFLESVDWEDSSINTLDLVAAVYYDIDTGTPVTPYLGAGGGVAQVSVTVQENTTLDKYEVSDSVWALAFQAAAGAGFAVFDGVTTSIGYRLTGTTEATFKSDNRIALALGHHIELGIRYQF